MLWLVFPWPRHVSKSVGGKVGGTCASALDTAASRKVQLRIDQQVQQAAQPKRLPAPSLSATCGQQGGAEQAVAIWTRRFDCWKTKGVVEGLYIWVVVLAMPLKHAAGRKVCHGSSRQTMYCLYCSQLGLEAVGKRTHDRVVPLVTGPAWCVLGTKLPVYFPGYLEDLFKHSMSCRV